MNVGQKVKGMKSDLAEIVTIRSWALSTGKYSAAMLAASGQL